VLTIPEQRRNGTISAKFLFFDVSSRLRDGQTLGRKSSGLSTPLGVKREEPAVRTLASIHRQRNFSGYAEIGAQTDNIQRNVLLSYDIALRSH
jgi:hypothetical protein